MGLLDLRAMSGGVWMAAVLLVGCGAAAARPSPAVATGTWTDGSSADARANLQPRDAEGVAAASAASQPAPSTPAPTWAAIYDRYLAAHGSGGCARSAACHRSQMGDAPSAYQWLRQRGYIDGTGSALVRSNSCLRWFGGNMPPHGNDDPRAVVDLSAWVAAGAREE
jgi:hypothetical protein